MTLQDLYFDVTLQETTSLFKKPFASHISHCIVRKDTQKVLHTCTASFNLIKNQELIEPVHQGLIKRYGLSGFVTEIISYDNTKFFVRFLINDRAASIQTGDELLPCIEIGNSYNGKLRSFVQMGFYRIQSRSSLKAYAFNLSNNTKRRETPQVNSTFLEKGFKEYDKKISHFKKLNQRQFTEKEYLSFMGDIRAIGIFPNTLINLVLESFEKEASRYHFKKSPWLLYCTFNKVLFAADFKMHLDERIKRDLKISKLIEAFA